MGIEEDPETNNIEFDNEENEVYTGKKRKTGKKTGGGFQSMGLSYPVIKGILKRGYKIPTPIQRKVN